MSFDDEPTLTGRRPFEAFAFYTTLIFIATTGLALVIITAYLALAQIGVYL